MKNADVDVNLVMVTTPPSVAFHTKRALQLAAFVLPALLVFILALRFWKGMAGSDDLGYAELAFSMLDPLNRGDQFGHHAGRVGMTMPLALVFYVFGVSNWSLFLLTLVSTVLTASLVAILAHRLFGIGTAVISSCLYAFFPMTVNLATNYVPEPLVNFELTLASILFLSAIKIEGRRAQKRNFLAGLLVGTAYLTTEAGALLIVVFGIYLVVRRLMHSKHLWILSGFATVLCIELASNAAIHGNPLYRFSLGGDYINDPMLKSSNVDIIYRLLKAYPSYFIYPNMDFGALGPLLMMGGVYGLVKFHKCSFLVIWAAVIFGFYNFMSVSVTHYVALPVASRLIFPGCIPLFILAGKVLADLWQEVNGIVWPVLRIIVLTSFAAMLGSLMVASLVCLDIASSTLSFTAMIARNAETAATYLEKIPSITLVSDARSAAAVKFYRKFSRQDSYIDFNSASQVLDRISVVNAEKSVFLLLNEPLLHEQEITGSRYGGYLSMDTDSATVAKVLPPSCKHVFSAHIDERQPVFHSMRWHHWMTKLFNIPGHGADVNPLFTQVQVLQCYATFAGSTSPAESR